MGTVGRSIIGMDVDELLDLLNKAYASEWLAYYQYWLGAKLIKGPMKDAVATELLQHAGEELAHAEMLSDRIIQIGGTPATSPESWYTLSPCKYDPPDDPYVSVLLDQNIAGEQCAIKTYDNLLKVTQDTDRISQDIVLRILEQEIEHEEDLQSLKEDLELAVKRGI